ncbi:MAG: hypothetical protein Q9186_006825 [Xanthomendoza sp. 1 TL-2023]
MFRREKWSNFGIHEYEAVHSKIPETFIQLEFTYHGRPEGRDVTVCLPPQPLWETEEEARHDYDTKVLLGLGRPTFSWPGARGNISSGPQSTQQQNVVSDSKTFPIARFCQDTGVEDFTPLQVRLTFVRIKGKRHRWSWLATCVFLSGCAEWIAKNTREEMLRQEDLPLVDLVSQHRASSTSTPGTAFSLDDLIAGCNELNRTNEAGLSENSSALETIEHTLTVFPLLTYSSLPLQPSSNRKRKLTDVYEDLKECDEEEEWLSRKIEALRTRQKVLYQELRRMEQQSPPLVS